MYSNIMIAIDPCRIEQASEAMKVAKMLGNEDAEITIFSVIEEPPSYFADQISGETEHTVRSNINHELERFIGRNNVSAKIVIHTGHASGAIVDRQLHEEHDLVIISSHKPHDMDHLMGATAQNVVRRAECPVFIVR